MYEDLKKFLNGKDPMFESELTKIQNQGLLPVTHHSNHLDLIAESN